MLEEQMILAVYVYGSVRVVEPPAAAGRGTSAVVHNGTRAFIMLLNIDAVRAPARLIIRRGVASFRLDENVAARAAARARLRCGASYFMSRYVDSDTFGRRAITAAQSTARSCLTAPLVSRALFRVGQNAVFIFFFRASINILNLPTWDIARLCERASCYLSQLDKAKGCARYAQTLCWTALAAVS